MADKFEIRVQDWQRKTTKYNVSSETQLDNIVRRETSSKWVAAIFVSKNGGRAKKVHSKKAKQNPFLKKPKDFS